MTISILLFFSAILSAAVSYNGEVVGCRGRIGSFLIRAGNGALAPIGREDSPGSKSPPDSPIYVAVPATEVPLGM